MKCIQCGEEVPFVIYNERCWKCYFKQIGEQGNYAKTEKLHTGWICPKCGYIWAPQVEGCDYCNAPQMIQEISIDDGGTNHADKTRP